MKNSLAAMANPPSTRHHESHKMELLRRQFKSLEDDWKLLKQTNHPTLGEEDLRYIDANSSRNLVSFLQCVSDRDYQTGILSDSSRSDCFLKSRCSSSSSSQSMEKLELGEFNISESLLDSSNLDMYQGCCSSSSLSSKSQEKLEMEEFDIPESLVKSYKSDFYQGSRCSHSTPIRNEISPRKLMYCLQNRELPVSPPSLEMEEIRSAIRVSDDEIAEASDHETESGCDDKFCCSTSKELPFESSSDDSEDSWFCLFHGRVGGRVLFMLMVMILVTVVIFLSLSVHDDEAWVNSNPT